GYPSPNIMGNESPLHLLRDLKFEADFTAHTKNNSFDGLRPFLRVRHDHETALGADRWRGRTQEVCKTIIRPHTGAGTSGCRTDKISDQLLKREELTAHRFQFSDHVIRACWPLRSGD